MNAAAVYTDIATQNRVRGHPPALNKPLV